MNILLSYFPCLSCFSTRTEDPERQRLFPPPNTILTPPRPRHRLPPIDLCVPSSGDSSTAHSPTSAYRKYTSPPLDTASRERIGSISRAYQGRMRNISRPSRPGSTTSSAAPTPHPTQTTFTEPNRPAAPHLGRSVSEPRSLHFLATHTPRQSLDFAAHQLPDDGHSDGLTRRARSATIIDRLSPLHSRHASEDSTPRPYVFGSRRGRSPGPSTAEGIGRSRSAGHVPDMSTPDISEGEEEEGANAIPVEQGVVVHDLGLRELAGQGSIRRGRGGRGSRGRPGRGGREIRRVTS